MFISSALLAVVALLPSFAVASPMQKRYTNQVIKSYRTGTCLTLQGGVQIVDGSLLRVGDCATATRWDISPGSGSVIVSGTNFALDAGTNPHNNVPAKVWTSFPGLTQQTWYLTPDNRIAITGGNQCLDEGDNGPQTYQCTTGNTNQIWYVSNGGGSSSSSSGPTSSSSSSGPPSATGKAIKWKSNPSSCLQVNGNAANGTPVILQNCINPTAPGANTQQFNILGNGLIQYAANTNFCLDAGINPSNGVKMKIWQCYPGLSQQTWTPFNGNTAFFQTANNQCLDIANQDFVTVQTWACSAPDPQQQFIVA